MPSKKTVPDVEKLDRVVAEVRRNREQRERSYREQALRMYPWVCGKCGREFTRQNVHELTVHHRDHDHDNNPPDGSNWELLCLYCHDNEHARYVSLSTSGEQMSEGKPNTASTHKPFANLENLLKRKTSK